MIKEYGEDWVGGLIASNMYPNSRTNRFSHSFFSISSSSSFLSRVKYKKELYKDFLPLQTFFFFSFLFFGFFFKIRKFCCWYCQRKFSLSLLLRKVWGYWGVLKVNQFIDVVLTLRWNQEEVEVALRLKQPTTDKYRISNKSSIRVREWERERKGA